MVAEAWGGWGYPISHQSGSRKRHAIVQLGFFFSFRQGMPAQGMVLFTVMLVSPPSWTQSSNFLTNLPRGWSSRSSEILSSWESLSIMTYWNGRCNWEKQIKILTGFVSQVVTFWCLLKATLSVSNANPGQSEQPSLLQPTDVYSLSLLFVLSPSCWMALGWPWMTRISSGLLFLGFWAKLTSL